MYAISLTIPAQGWLSMSMRKWAALIYIGKRIKEDVLYNRRADYGKQVIKNLSLRLTERYGKGWSEKTLRHCLRAAETFSEADIVSAVQRQFNWTQLKVASLFLSVRHEIQSCLTRFISVVSIWHIGIPHASFVKIQSGCKYSNKQCIQASAWDK